MELSRSVLSRSFHEKFYFEVNLQRHRLKLETTLKYSNLVVLNFCRVIKNLDIWMKAKPKVHITSAQGIHRPQT